MPVARNLEELQRSSPQRDDALAQALKLGGWLLLCVLVLSLTVNEVLGWLVSPAAVERDPPGQGRDIPSISSDKLASLLGNANAELKLWSSPAEGGQRGGESVAAAAARLSAEFTSLRDGVRALQESLAKSRSVGSAVGLETWDHDKRQALLKKEQVAVEEQGSRVHALARRIIQGHEEHQASRGGRGGDGGGDGAGAATFQRPADEERELMNKLGFGLGEADVGGLRLRLREMEAQINAAVSTEDAEQTADRYAAAVREGRGAQGGAGDRPGQAREEEITRVVEEVVLSVDPPLVRESCVSVELAQNVTKMELERYGADRTGIPDYAMGPAGARVISRLTSETFEAPMGFFEKMASRRRKDSLQAVSQPPVAINPESRLGMCWAMKGREGKLTVKLSQPITVETVSLEHAPRELLLNKGISAPKDFTVFGHRKDLGVTDENGDVLVDGQYKIEGDVIQSFEVAEEYRQEEYSVVTLQVHSNHGEEAYTCIYRLRVHGQPAS
eukprot:g8010.t1